MKILFFVENFPPEHNAQASRVYERACYWVSWGHDVTVVTGAPNFPEGKVYDGYKNRWHLVEHVSGIRVIRVKTFISANKGKWMRIADFLSFMFSAFFAALFEPKPDIVVASSPQFFAAVGAWALSRAKRVPFIFELADLWPASIVAVGAMRPSLFLRWMEKLELYLYKQSAAVIALTDAFKDDLVTRGIDSAKVFVVRNGVDLLRYAPRPRDQALAAKWGIEPEHFVIGYVGTHGMAHALENVLDAAESVQKTCLRFLFVGGGAARESLVAEAARRGLRNVIFVPPQAKDQMPAYWSLCNVALVHLKDTPLFKTVIPSKIFEAMGMGVPILLASPKGEASYIVESRQAGLWVPPQDASKLVHAAMLLEENKELYHRLGANSLASAPLFSREKQAREMMAVLERKAGQIQITEVLPVTPGIG
jgi:glycosyltransferase involved in cell wall biosynthesis